MRYFTDERMVNLRRDAEANERPPADETRPDGSVTAAAVSLHAVRSRKRCLRQSTVSESFRSAQPDEILIRR